MGPVLANVVNENCDMYVLDQVLTSQGSIAGRAVRHFSLACDLNARATQ